MALKDFKSLNKIPKLRNGINKDKLKMFYTEVYDVSPRHQKKYLSTNLHGEFLNAGLGLQRENLPSELLSLINGKMVENKRSNAQKNKSKEIKPQKHKSYDSRHRSHQVTSKSKDENKDKTNQFLKREVPIKKRDFIVKQIPLKKDLLEFSIDHSHCPMVVRIHKGHLKSSKNKKQGSVTEYSQPLIHSVSCPPSINDKFKTATNKTSVQRKEKIKKSKCRLMSHGYAISELLNLSPRKFGFGGKKSDSDIFMDINKSDRYTKKILKNKCRLQHNCVNEQVCSCSVNNIKDVNNNYYINKKSLKSHKTSVNEKNQTKLAEIKFVNDCKSGNSNSSDQLNTQKIVNTYSSFTLLRGTNATIKDEKLYKEFINKACEDRPKSSQMKQTGMKEKVLMTEKNMINYNNYFVQNHDEEETSLIRKEDCYCQKCENNEIQRKKLTFPLMCQASPEIPHTVNSKKMFDPQESEKLRNTTTERKTLPRNVVILDASQSQFYKISDFLENNTSKCDEETSSEQIHQPLLAQKNSSVFDEQECTKKNANIKYLYPSVWEKVRSDERYLNKYIYNEKSGSLINPSKCNSKQVGLSKSCFTTTCNLDYNQTEIINSKSLPYQKCLGCNKIVYKVGNFDPYCSDCNLKAKLSQISNESTSTNPDSVFKERLTDSIKALTVIPESDFSLSKKLVNVAIQTESDLGENTQKYKNMIINQSCSENTNDPCHQSWEDIFKMYFSMTTQFKKLQESPSNTKASLSKSRNADFMYDENQFCGDFERQRLRETDNNSSQKNQQSQPNYDPRKCYSTADNLKFPALSSVKPNIYTATMTNDNFQKYSLKKSGIENNPLQHEKKTLVSSFISPIFPEKKYFRITCNNNPCLVAKPSSETLNSNHFETKCSQTYMLSPNDINFPSGSNNNQRPSDCFPIKSGTSHKIKNVKSFQGSYISYEERLTLGKELNNCNNLTYLPKENSIKGNSELSFCRPKRGTSIPERMNVLNLPHLSHSFMTKKDYLISLDNNLKGIQNIRTQESSPKSTRHTLLNSTKSQGQNCLSPHQYLQFQNCMPDLTYCHLLCNTPPIHQQGPVKSSKGEMHCLGEECLLISAKSNNQFNEPVNVPSIGLYTQYKRVNDQIPTINGIVKGINYGHSVVMNNSPSLIDSKKYTEQSEMNQSFKGTSASTDVFEHHSFSYILFKMSVTHREYVTSETEESSRKKVPSSTSLMSMPEKAGIADNLNDFIFRNKLNSKIHSKLSFKQESIIHDINVHELSALSKWRVVLGVGNDLQIHSLESDSLQNIPPIYKAVPQSIKVNKSNCVFDLGSKEQDRVSEEKVDLLDSSVVDTNNENQGKINNNSSKKNKSKNATEKIAHTKKPKEERKKFMKINNMFMCGYMAQLSLLRFVGGFQSRMCSNFKK